MLSAKRIDRQVHCIQESIGSHIEQYPEASLAGYDIKPSWCLISWMKTMMVGKGQSVVCRNA